MLGCETNLSKFIKIIYAEDNSMKMVIKEKRKGKNYNYVEKKPSIDQWRNLKRNKYKWGTQKREDYKITKDTYSEWF